MFNIGDCSRFKRGDRVVRTTLEGSNYSTDHNHPIGSEWTIVDILDPFPAKYLLFQSTQFGEYACCFELANQKTTHLPDFL